MIHIIQSLAYQIKQHCSNWCNGVTVNTMDSYPLPLILSSLQCHTKHTHTLTFLNGALYYLVRIVMKLFSAPKIHSAILDSLPSA